MGKNKPPPKAPAPAAPFNNPFAALATKREALPSAPEGPVVPASAPTRQTGPARAVVRMERKGRGGKEVTVVEHLELDAAALEEWLKALKNGLGCGGVVEDSTLVLQGDQRERIPALLSQRGVRKVVIG